MVAARISDIDLGKLDRLLVGLKKVGIEHGIRNKTVADATGYSEKTVGNLLSGQTKLTPRFLRSIYQAFPINPNWVDVGQDPVLTPVFNDMLTSPSPGLRNKTDEVIRAWFNNELTFEERLRIFREVAEKVVSDHHKNNS